MRVLVFSCLIVFLTPHASIAQGDAAMAAARAATGSSVGKPAAKATGTAAASAKPEAKASEAPQTTGTATGATVATGLPPQGYTYTPEGRRDPFVSLLRRGTGVDASASNGPRPAGLKGLTTGEVTLKGTMASQGTFVGILQGADARTYVVRPGEKLSDGTIRSITADALVIVQQVSDPLSRETQREVRKVLRQTEEAR